MSLSLSILASGSAGNCSVLRGSGKLILIDCGIGPRTAARRMKHLGVAPRSIAAICLTHLDHDHFNPVWVSTILRENITIHCHENRAEDLARMGGDCAEFSALIRPFSGRRGFEIEGLEFTAIHLDHDEWGSQGFLVRSKGASLGYATDLGNVSERLVQHFCGVGMLAIESNYDPNMQMNSSRPWFLKRRIMGGRGHLSNHDALGAVRQILDRSQRRGRALPRHIVLLHRSRECNCPNLLRELFSADSRIEGRLVLAEQHEPTDWLHAGEEAPMMRQMELQWA